MQVTVEDVNSVKKILHIEVPEEVVARELDSAYKELKKTSKIKGFRPGKAPRSVLERMFGKDVNADVSSKLIQSSLIDTLREKELPVVGEPKVDSPDLTGPGAYAFDITVELRPEIADVEFKGLDLTKTKYEHNEEEVEAQIEMLRKNLAKKVEIEEARPAAEGDFLLLDYEGFQGGEPFDGAQKTENFTLKLGSGTIAKAFDDEVVGMNMGDEKEFSVIFPEDHFNSTLAGQAVDYKVKLNKIMREELPEVNDEFAKQFGKFDTLEALRAEIVGNLEQGYAKRVDQELNEQIFENLIEKTEFEVPEVMVEYELDGIVSEAERAFAANNITMEQVGQSVEKIRENYRDTAVKQVRRHLILGKIIEQEEMVVDDAELEAGFQEMADNFNQPAEAIKAFYKENPDKVEFFKHTLLEKKAIKLIIESSNVTEVEPEKESDEEKVTDEGASTEA